MNEQAVLIAIGLVVAVVVLSPLLRGARGRTASAVAVTPQAEAMPEELAELELDRAMGRVSEADYARFRSELEIPPAVDAGVTVEPEDDNTARAEALVRRWREAPRPTCPTCGVRPEPGARYCSTCGASLAP